MKTLKALCAATVLALSLSISALADTNPGDGHSPGKNITAPTGIETSTQGLTNTVTTGATTIDGDGSIVVLADIIWALAFMF